MKKLTSLLVAAVVAVGAAELCLYTVGEREYALVFALGELKDVKSEPGLYVKLPAPLQNIVYLDKRILTLDAPNADLVQTSEKKNLLIDSFVRWRIADPRKYWVSFIGRTRRRGPCGGSFARCAQPDRQPQNGQRDYVPRT